MLLTKHLSELIMSHWSIGVYSGKCPTDLHPIDEIKNPILSPNQVTDVKATLVADPFMIQIGKKWYLFFEVYNKGSHRGEIGLAESDGDLSKWRYRQIVLRNKVHLSYPYVFYHNKAYYMIPETGNSNSIQLYKASKFPTKWVKVKDLIKGEKYLDSSIIFDSGYWWLFTSVKDKGYSLKLYLSRSLTGSWKEHPLSPVISNDYVSGRCGGRIIKDHNKIIRYSQVDYPTYGYSLNAYEITSLTNKTYSEKLVGNPINAKKESWCRDGTHTIDTHELNDGKWIAAIDGKTTLFPLQIVKLFIGKITGKPF